MNVCVSADVTFTDEIDMSVRGKLLAQISSRLEIVYERMVRTYSTDCVLCVGRVDILDWDDNTYAFSFDLREMNSNDRYSVIVDELDTIVVFRKILDYVLR